MLLRGILDRRHHTVSLIRIIVHKISDFQSAPSLRFHELESSSRISTLPFAKRLDDMLNFPDLVLRAFARIDGRDVDDRLFFRI